jgi:hypothetical protein
MSELSRILRFQSLLPVRFVFLSQEQLSGLEDLGMRITSSKVRRVWSFLYFLKVIF